MYADEAVLVLVHVVKHLVQSLDFLILLEQSCHESDDAALEDAGTFELHHVVADLHML